MTSLALNICGSIAKQAFSRRIPETNLAFERYDEGRISRKNLMMEFDRRGEGSKVDSNEIQYKNVHKWVYRDASSAEVDLKRPDSIKPPGK